MVRRSSAAKAKFEKRKAELESELGKYQQLIRNLRSSSESRLMKTKKQKVFHKKVTDIKNQLDNLR